MTEAQIEHERKMNECVFQLARTNREYSEVESEVIEVIKRYLRSWPDTKVWDEKTVDRSSQCMAAVICTPAYRSLLRQDPAAIIQQFSGPLLAVFGGKDSQVLGEANAAAFREITNGRLGADVCYFPKHNHLFQIAGSGAISEYEDLPICPDLEVLRTIAEWLVVAEQFASPLRSDRSLE